LEVKSWGLSAMEGCCEGSQGPPRTVELEIIIIISNVRFMLLVQLLKQLLTLHFFMLLVMLLS
jgi:hypothetical protein